MKFFLYLFILVLPISIIGQNLRFKEYKPFTKQKILGYSIIAFSSLVDGSLEGYGHQGRKSFERKYGADPFGFWGSRSWEKLYTNPNFYNKNFGTFDFYHLADDTRKIGYITGGIILGIGGTKSNKKPIHYLYDFIISATISAAFKRAGLWWIKT